MLFHCSIPRSVLVGLALCGSFLVDHRQDGPPAQTPPEQGQEPDTPRQERDIFGRIRTLRPGTRSPIDGVWQLLDLDVEGYPQHGRSASGYLMIQEGHMAFQMEASWDQEEGDDGLEDGYQAFVAQYKQVGNVLSCMTLMGAYLDEEEEEFEYEEPGMMRRFEVTVDGSFLTLTWSEADVMTFGRLRTPELFGKSLFGEDRPGSDSPIKDADR